MLYNLLYITAGIRLLILCCDYVRDSVACYVIYDVGGSVRDHVVYSVGDDVGGGSGIYYGGGYVRHPAADSVTYYVRGYVAYSVADPVNDSVGDSARDAAA